MAVLRAGGKGKISGQVCLLLFLVLFLPVRFYRVQIVPFLCFVDCLVFRTRGSCALATNDLDVRSNIDDSRVDSRRNNKEEYVQTLLSNNL